MEAGSASAGDDQNKGNFFYLFKRLVSKKKKSSWSFKKSAYGLSWKKKNLSLSLIHNYFHWVIDNVVFKVVSVFEGIVLVSTLCLFFVCCGCHF